MNPSRFPLRARILVLVLAVLALVWGYVTVETIVLERGLKSLADAKASELARDASRQIPAGARADALAQVTAAKDYILFGPTRGKVHVFIRVQKPQHAPSFSVYDTFYVLEGHSWVEQESGVCADHEVQMTGRAAFASRTR